jgi:hypothetical protein
MTKKRKDSHAQRSDLQEYVPEYEVGLVWEDQMPPPHGFVPELASSR